MLPDVKYLQALFVSFLLSSFVSLRAQQPVIDSLTRLISTMPEDSNKVLVIRDLAFQYLQSDPSKGMELAGQMKDLSVKTNYTAGLGLAYDMEGNVLRMQGDFSNAIQKHLQALHIFDSLHLVKRYRSVLVNTGTDYSWLKNYNQALSCYQKALELTNKSEKPQYLTILNNMGNLFSTMKKHQEAVDIYMQALPLVRDDSLHPMRATLYSSLAIAYAELGELGKGTAYMLEAIRMHERFGDKYHYASSASTLGGFYVEMKQYGPAAEYLEKALVTAREIGARSVIANYYRNKAHMYYRMGRTREAYDTLNRFIELNDSLINEAHVAQLAENEVRFSTERKDRELALLNADKELKETRIRQQSLWNYIFLLFLLVIGLLLFFVYRNMQLKKKANQSLEAENTLLQKENILAQYETLRNQVNPHFLFNSLNALSSLIRNDTGKAQEFTTVFSRLYRHVLELKGHSVITLKEELGLVDDYIYLQKIRFGNSLVLTKNINVEALDLVLPPFCLQMLIENAIKHNIVSDESPLYISIFTDGGFLVVSNNLQPRHKNESTGVGIRNITERFRIIHDTLPEFYVRDHEYVARIPLIDPHT